MFGKKQEEKQAEQDSHIQLPSAVIEFNHRTKTVFMHVDIAQGVNEDDFSDLLAHLRKQGYELVIFTSSNVKSS